MDKSTEYEKNAQEIYQELAKTKGINTVEVEHDAKLIGKSGQNRQIDVYWEYEIAGIKHKFIIECKNYNRKISIDELNAFRSLLLDLSNVDGIMLAKDCFESELKRTADSHGINLKELNPPSDIFHGIGGVGDHIKTKTKRCLFLFDDEWAERHNMNWLSCRRNLDLTSSCSDEWERSDYLPLDIIRDASILDEKGQILATFSELESQSPQSIPRVYNFENAYVTSRYFGRVKLKAVKYVNGEKGEIEASTSDVQDMVRAILADALNGEMMFLGKNLDSKDA